MTIDTFIASAHGPWEITRLDAVRGPALDLAPRLRVASGSPVDAPLDASWCLRGAASHLRYATRPESDRFTRVQPALERPEASRAALIPLRKSPAWWALAQDERRAIFDGASQHLRIGMDYLPAIARRLLHGRDLGEPFDFLTWFEFAPEHEADFDALLRRLRATEEWGFVEREVEIRLRRV